MSRVPFKKFMACLAAVALATAGACTTSPVRSDGHWAEGVPRDASYARVLVLGISPDVNQRCAFEDSMVQALQGAGVTARAACAELGLHEPLTREAVERAIASFKADAVLSTRPLASGMEVREGGSRETRGAGYYKPTDLGFATDYWGMYGVPVVYGEFRTAPSEFLLQGSASLLSDLYGTDGARRVYSVETHAERLESRQQGLMIVTSDIAARLASDGLLATGTRRAPGT